MKANSDIIYLIDLNESRGGVVPVSVDFTVDYGPYVKACEPPPVGSLVKVHYDDDDTVFWAEVIEVEDDRDFVVRIDWTTGAPVLNKAWSAHIDRPTVDFTSPSRESVTA